MRIAIVDDVKADAEAVKELLTIWGGERAVELEICCFSGGEEFLGAFDPGRFDAVFMDIYMDDITGAKAAAAMREKDLRTVLVFLTISSEHVREAFACHAFEYIKKPPERDRIFTVMDDIMKILPGEERYIEFTCSRQTVRLLYSNLCAAVSVDHYLEITDSAGCTYKTRMKLYELSDRLMEDGRFLNINKGIIVNMDLIISFDANLCIMRGGQRLPVKVRERAQIEKQWLEYNFEKIRSSQRGRHNI